MMIDFCGIILVLMDYVLLIVQKSWYGILNRIVQYVYFNIYIIIKIFKDIQNVEDILRIQRRVGGIVCLLFKKYVIIKMRLQMLKERY